MKIYRNVLTAATIVVGAMSAYTGVIVYFIRGFQGEVPGDSVLAILAGLAVMEVTPILLGLYFLVVLWREGRVLTMSGLIVAAAALVTLFAAAGPKYVRDIEWPVTYLVLLMGYFGLRLLRR
jgi:hypothetical protein